MRNITVIGAGYVGLVTGTCFADLGNRVCCLDVDRAKIKTLQEGGVPIYEPGLHEMVGRNAQASRLSFTADYPEALADAEFVFIAVGTPEGVDGEADMQYVEAAAQAMACANTGSPVICQPRAYNSINCALSYNIFSKCGTCQSASVE